MTARSCVVSLAVVVVALSGLAGSAAAGETMKHSGKIIEIAGDGKTFVLAEVGPWRIWKSTTLVTLRTIRLMPDTAYAIVARDVDTETGFPGDFVETRLGADGLYLNDYVTVDCRHEGQRLLALKVTVTEPWAEEVWAGAAR